MVADGFIDTSSRKLARARMFDSVPLISVVWPPAEDAISSKRVNQLPVVSFTFSQYMNRAKLSPSQATTHQRYIHPESITNHAL